MANHSTDGERKRVPSAFLLSMAARRAAIDPRFRDAE
jgi:hypothetical protein